MTQLLELTKAHFVSVRQSNSMSRLWCIVSGKQLHKPWVGKECCGTVIKVYVIYKKYSKDTTNIPF